MVKVKRLALAMVVVMLFLAMLISTVKGALTDNIEAYYKFDSDLTTDIVNGHNFVNTGVTSVGGIINDGAGFTGGNDGLTTTTDLGDFATGTDSYTWNFWFNSTATGEWEHYIAYLDSANHIYIRKDTSDELQFQEIWGGNSCTYSTTGNALNTYLDGAFHMFTLIKNGTSCENTLHAFIDGANLGGSATGDGATIGTPDEVCAGNLCSDYQYGFTDRMDEIGFWKRAISQAEIDELYNSGSGLQYPFTGGPGVETPAITLDIGLENSEKINDDPYLLYFNGSVVNATDLFNCTLYLNDTLNDTNDNIVLNNTNQNFTLDTTGWEIGYNINISCERYEDAFLVYDNIQRTGVYFDTIEPNVVVTNLVNNSIYHKNLTAPTFHYNVSIYDPNLFAVNFTLYNSTGYVYNNTFNDTVTNSSFNFSFARDLNSFDDGLYYVDIYAWDDHTAKKIKDNYKIDYLSNGFIIEDDLKIYSEEIKNTLLWFDETKQDRYKFRVTFYENSLTHSFYIETKGDLYYKPISDYLGHFVYLPLNKWVDLENPNIKKVNIEQLANNKYKIDLELYTISDEIETDSIGDLNTVALTYAFNVSDGFYIYAREIELNFSIPNFVITVYNATISQTQNGTSGLAVINLTEGNYSINITATNYFDYHTPNVNFSIGGSFTAYMNLTNAFKVFIRDQITNDLIEPQPIYLEFIGINSSNYSTTTGYKFITDLNPDDYIIRYSSGNYSNAFHYFTLENGTNIQFTIYMIPNATSTEVSLYVYDENSNAVEDATIVVYRYNTVLNSYVMVHNLRTDFEGKALLYVSLNSEFYKFYIYYEDDLKLQTTGAYITGTELSFNIVLQDPILQDYYTWGDIDGYVSYNENTHNFRFWYNDPGNVVTQGCFYLYQVTYTQETLFNSTCVNSTSSLILLYAQNVSGMTYIGKGYVTINGAQTLFDSFSYTFQAESGYGNLGVFIVIFLTLVAGLGFMWDISVGLIVLPLPTLLGSLSFTRWINIPTSYAVGVEVIFIVLALIIKRR